MSLLAYRYKTTCLQNLVVIFLEHESIIIRRLLECQHMLWSVRRREVRILYEVLVVK